MYCFVGLIAYPSTQQFDSGGLELGLRIILEKVRLDFVPRSRATRKRPVQRSRGTSVLS